MTSVNMRKLFSTICFSIVLAGCGVQSGIDYEGMASAEKAWNRKAREQLVAYMSLDTMFPDKQVRALAKAAGKGDIKKIESLVAKGVDVNYRGTRNATPLFWSMRNIKGFEKLLELGADPNVIFHDGGTVVHWSVDWSIHKGKHDRLRAVLRHKGDPNLVAGRVAGRPGLPPLFDTIVVFGKIEIGNTPSLTMLLDAGADIDARGMNGDTPALYAAWLGRFDIVYELLDRGADYKARNYFGRDLIGLVETNRKAMDPNHELYMWLEKVSAWLTEHGAEIPE